MSDYHTPVMLEEALGFLNIQTDYWYIDCNIGGGGHTKGILQRGGKVLGIDLDQDAIAEVSKRFKSEIDVKRLILVQSNFSNVDQAVKELGLKNIKGVLFDLGVSSHQLEDGQRGFSFNQDVSLDMRMDQNMGVKASDLVNGLHEGELSELIQKYGEDNFAKKIARAIVKYRNSKAIESTNELAQIIASSKPRSFSDRTHPATRTFQALRIAVNDELNSLKEALPKAFDVLDKDGRLVVISFHSLEDRIVKNIFKELVEDGKAKELTKKPLLPTDQEIAGNPRSRSGKLRAMQKRVP